MRELLLSRLRCPACHAERAFELDPSEHDEREVRSGALRCGRCGHEAGVERGVVDLLHDPPASVLREAAGLARFADVMRADGWDRERILNLPDDELAYWRGQARQLERLLERIDVRAGQTLLDVGSNTCWASNAFAELGLEVIALDISTAEMQGLHTADWWMEANGVHFERVLSTMAEPAIASGSLDWVFCCEVLHHNPPSDLRRTLRELHRVLRPGGSLLVLNEPLRYPTNLKREHGAEVAQFEGNENVYFFHEYLGAVRRAGFEAELLEPPTPVFTGDPLWLVRDSSALGSTKLYAQQLLRRSRAGRRMLLWWSMLLGPDGNVSMICRKPAAG
jgi:SAM-dependent methyltransferase